MSEAVSRGRNLELGDRKRAAADATLCSRIKPPRKRIFLERMVRIIVHSTLSREQIRS